ncbi:MAG: GNAT family N-acetyltransferase [Bryobacteraceae bacterium]|nr:GNAT family N-acetyltransferase [Bryobacteraceae bacterium]
MAHSPEPVVRIRPLHREDAPSITALLENDAEGISWTGRIPWPFTLADANVWLDLVLPAGNAFAIEVDGQFAGCAGFDRGEVGYWVGLPFRGRGVASRALSQLLQRIHAADHRHARATVFPGNDASVRILEKHGFRLTGEEEHDLPKRGGLRKLLIFELDL